MPTATASNGRHVFRRAKPEPGAVHPLLLRETFDGPDWVALLNPDFGNPGMNALSPDGRLLAWTMTGGAVMVADLELLRQEVTAFERELGLR